MSTIDPRSNLFIGVDGGGTKTSLTLIDSAGTVLTTLTVGSTNPNSVGDAEASTTLQTAITSALTTTSCQQSNIRSIVLSISGCNSAADAVRMQDWLKSMFPHSKRAENLSNNQTGSSSSYVAAGSEATAAVSSSAASTPPVLLSAYNDSISALVSGTGGVLSGIVLISGTGMICKGFSSTGQEATSGGNGALIDDGAGYMIGLHTLKAVFAGDSGMGPQCEKMRDALLSFLNLQRVEQLVDWLYAQKEWAAVASVGKVAFDCADTCEVAKKIIDVNAEYLVRSVVAVAKQLKINMEKEEVMVVCAGGILTNPSGVMFKLVTSGVKSFIPNAKLVLPSVSSSEGAALLARKQCNETQQQAK